MNQNVDIDQETAHELMSDFDLHQDIIEGILAKLLVQPAMPLLHQLFREVHTIKGNAGLFGLTEIVQFVHALEDLIGALRAEQLQISQTLADVILMAMDRARDLHQIHLCQAHFDPINTQGIAKALRDIIATPRAQQPQALEYAINILTKHFDAGHLSTLSAPLAEPLVLDMDASHIQLDLSFFKSLALQLDKQSPFWSERSHNLLRWAFKMNAASQNPVDPHQLEVAVYLHDVGMAFLDFDVLSKNGKLTTAEFQQLQEHTRWGAEWVARMPAWQTAATIIAQHHERFDGTGYPQKLAGEAIHPGARILAILDAFYAIINDRADRARKRSILRGVSEINACSNSQFCPYWVDVFNGVIRDEVRQGGLGAEPSPP